MADYATDAAVSEVDGSAGDENADAKTVYLVGHFHQT